MTVMIASRQRLSPRQNPKARLALIPIYSIRSSEKPLECRSFDATYVDRFRIRHPGVHGFHTSHVELGGAIERWEDSAFRTCLMYLAGLASTRSSSSRLGKASRQYLRFFLFGVNDTVQDFSRNLLMR
ncbi:hypothetical protein BT96DRAFT_309128 [Gymnopus androsaceus JB14]|uniref:Uncharacterized protein n=1 Tax=Gymnopus androsaceus JB14 TaxID=1447944 RepID=A0A6A4H142_9AGAR|nr:hypothetical protein BT96DRAFT_309128 [Gymnopus androsaceus JB14]